jgi:hypothetical protein
MTERVVISFKTVPGHECSITRGKYGELTAACACGATWTYKSNATDSEMKSLWESHLGYFDKGPTVIL